MMRITIFILAALVAYVSAHCVLHTPKARQALYSRNELKSLRFRPFDIQAMQCGWSHTLPDNPNKKCGICGEKWDVYPKRLERGGDLYQGTIQEVYKKGSTIPVTLKMNANHGGDFEFRICSADGLDSDPTMECFDNNKLTLAPGLTWNGKEVGEGLTSIPVGMAQNRTNIKYNWGSQLTWVYNIELPKDLTCENCIFQWRWYSGLDRNDQLYFNCADVKIEE